MNGQTNRISRWMGWSGVVAGALLILAVPVHAQQGGSGGSISGGATSFGGGSGGSISGGATSFGGGSGMSGGTLSGGGTSMSGGIVGGLGTTAFRSSGSSTTSTSSGVATSNLFASYYANPMALGLTTSAAGPSTSTVGFGQPIYGTSTGTTATGALGTAGISRGGAGQLGGSSYQGGGFNAFGSGYGTGQLQVYSMTPVFSPTRASGGGGRLQTDLQQVIARSSSLTTGGNIQVAVEGQVVILRGTVPNERERRLAEGLVRLSPGVRGVRNDLEVKETLPQPRRGP